MSVLYKDPKYEYCYQLSLWIPDVKELASMLEPFTGPVDHAVVRHNKHGEFAVFTKGKASQAKRYKLEVLLECTVTSTF